MPFKFYKKKVGYAL